MEYTYFGMQKNKQCWCGDDRYDRHGVTDGCDCYGKIIGNLKQCVYTHE